MIKLYTSKHCPICEQVKAALKPISHQILSAEDHMDDLIKEVTDRKLDHRQIRQAPVMVVPGCDLIWTGADCLIAIEEKEWE
ncbi:MAG TPA: glutaredoxin family protein [Pontiellaceae bacterium]|nr:glutaredoxin family protein [Pontiellaceae bacterium]HPR82575.1 glutaredoxin family protein [Pontiellaceae bacterium]